MTPLNGTAVDITALGSPALISLFTIIGLVTLTIKKDKMGALFLALNVIGSTLWMSVLKNIIARNRPTIIPRLIEVEGLSYPSGHSLVSTATFLSLAFLLCRHIHSKKLITSVLISTGFIIFLVAFSRLYLGVHYPSDVISGILFGISWVLWLTALFKTFSRQNIPNLN
jgi:undecaprenyl-diphosphatase